MGNDDVEQPPLDAAQLQLQRRLRRLMFIAVATLGVGIIAVLLAIVYRLVNSDSDPTAPQPVRDIVAVLPEGAEILDISLDGDLVGVLVAVPGAAGGPVRRLLVYDADTGALERELTFAAP